MSDPTQPPAAGELPPGVSRTALGVAMVRAVESRRPDRLFHDPYAAVFLAAAPTVLSRDHPGAVAVVGGLSTRGRAFWSHAVVRTRFFDDFLRDATGAGGIRQVVLLAAGLDTRAYRLDWPNGVRLFEVDLPDVIDFKQRVLDSRGAVPACGRTAVAADLRDDWASALTNSGFRRERPTAWLPEGLLLYLSADEAARLLVGVSALAAPGSRLAIEHDNVVSMVEHARTMPMISQYAALWKEGLSDAPQWLMGHGWRVTAHDRARVCARYARAAESSSGGGFLTAIRTGEGRSAQINRRAAPDEANRRPPEANGSVHSGEADRVPETGRCPADG